MASYFEPAALYTRKIPILLPGLPTEAVTVVTNAAANTSGAWVQITAGLTVDHIIYGYHVRGMTAATPYELDFGTGAAGLEVVIGTFKDYLVAAGDYSQKLNPPAACLFLAANTRLAARNRSGGAGSANQFLAVYAVPA